MEVTKRPEIHWAITVAIAAPLTPSPRPKGRPIPSPA